jgi:hypothetical protein
MLLLRVGRRATDWASGDLDKVINGEFLMRGLVELQASVYQIEETQLVRAVAEHGASNKLGMRGFANIDLSSDRAFVEAPGDSMFEFTRVAHRELHFADEDDLRTFLRTQILPTVDRRRHVVPRAKIKEYVTSRLTSRDAEWLAYVEAHGQYP